MSAPARLLGDVGGTNARFALQRAKGAPLEAISVLPAKDHATLGDAIRRYLRDQGDVQPEEAAIGIANPITGDHVAMTNHHWAFSISSLCAELGMRRLLVINDFEALARALPALPESDLRRVGGREPDAGAPRAVIGPGTGLGMAGLLSLPDGRHAPITGEGGHATVPAADDTESRLLGWLRERHGHVSAERVLSGGGLVNLHDAVRATAGVPGEPWEAAEISRRALAGDDPHCVQAVQHFLAFLGSVAGNLALTLGARGGVYVGGGIVPRLMPLVPASRLRQRFEAKGRFAPYLEPVPLWVIDRQDSPALLGVAGALDG